MALEWPAHDPADYLDYYVDWSNELDGDIIVNSNFALTTTGTLAISAQSFANTVSSIWIEGGTVGEVGKFVNEIETLGGRVENKTVLLKVATQ